MNGFLFYALAFAVLLGVLIVVHELGHFLVARGCGVKVLRFSVGFGRPLLTMRCGRDRTEWVLAAFPLGGYVKMLDEREGEVVPEELPRSFNRQSVWKRMAIVVAGPLANFLFAVALYWGIFYHGSEELRPLLGRPVVESSAAFAGLMDGERVAKVDGVEILTWQDLRWALIKHAVDRDFVELEVINPQHEIAFRRLDLARARSQGWEGDAIEKLGLTLYRPQVLPIIGSIAAGSAAEAAGLRTGDRIVAIGAVEIDAWQEVVQRVRAAPGQQLDFSVIRNGALQHLTLTPAVRDENGVQIGRIGAGVRDGAEIRRQLMVNVHYGVFESLSRAVQETWDKTVFSVEMIGRMLLGEVSWKNISGPVSSADYAGQSARLGVDYYLKFMALVSVSLGVLNLLPVPILDGGHLLYYVAEIIKGGPLSERSLEVSQRIGMALLLLLMACAFYNDITRLLSG